MVKKPPVHGAVTQVNPVVKGLFKSVVDIVIVALKAGACYLQPNGTNVYKRPDGTSLYLRPE